MNLLFRPWLRCLDFRGRSRRLEFVLFHVQIWAVVAAILYFGVPARFGSPEGVSGQLAALLAVLAVTLIPGLAVTVRRLHDCDMSGWYAIAGAITIAFFFLLALFLAIQAGSEGPNHFGADPRDPDGGQELDSVFS